MDSDISNHKFPIWIWAVYLILFVLSIPWYLPEINPIPVWFGMPFWVLICLGIYFLIACFTAFVIHKYWQENG